MNDEEIKNIIEAALLASASPLSMDSLLGLFQGVEEPPGRDALRAALGALAEDYGGRGIELKEVASGYRVQVREGYAERIKGLWAERPARYSRALLETLALIAYRQPITRGEIEDIRGVAVSTNIVRTLEERGWIRVVGHRDVPGHPAMYGTTRDFLDYFNLKSLADLPSLAEIRDIDEITRDLFRDEGVAVAEALPPREPGGAEETAAAAGAGSEVPHLKAAAGMPEMGDGAAGDDGGEATGGRVSDTASDPAGGKDTGSEPEPEHEPEPDSGTDPEPAPGPDMDSDLHDGPASGREAVGDRNKGDEEGTGR